ncbi:MAG TPA: EF-Tu/IF-2/RF-3 family GTPase [Methanocella sp.]|nr:EF-Tu/IF-2/RF-3 family GTPase [Methanocella sp.]
MFLAPYYPFRVITMVNAALIGGEQSGKTTLALKLGKKGTESDIVLYNFVKGNNILAVIDPVGYPKSPKPLINAANMSDVIVFCVDAKGLDARAGECIIMLDLLRPKHGLITITKADTSNPYAIDELKNKIRLLAKGTILESWEILPTSTKSFEGVDRLKEILFEIDNQLKEESKALNDEPARVPIDHHFNVTGVGTVILGYVRQGTIHVREKLLVWPIKQEAEIRSIQMNDVDVKEAPAGSRVGLALKNVQSKDLDRGYILSKNEEVGDTFTLNCTTAKFKGEFKPGEKIHVYAGLQSSPGNVVMILDNGKEVDTTKSSGKYAVHIKTDKELAYTTGDLFLLSRLEEPKQRFLASGNV